VNERACAGRILLGDSTQVVNRLHIQGEVPFYRLVHRAVLSITSAYYLHIIVTGMRFIDE